MKGNSRLTKPLVKRLRAFFKAYKGLLADVLLVGALLLFLWTLYERFGRGFGWAAWTGFGGETLLDWLELLIIPIFIAVGAWWLDRRQKKTEREFE
jgi:hypothetical protein